MRPKKHGTTGSSERAYVDKDTAATTQSIHAASSSPASNAASSAPSSVSCGSVLPSSPSRPSVARTTNRGPIGTALT
jgi:hypothetical protein